MVQVLSCKGCKTEGQPPEGGTTNGILTCQASPPSHHLVSGRVPNGESPGFRQSGSRRRPITSEVPLFGHLTACPLPVRTCRFS